MKRTKLEIEAAIQELQAIKPKVRKRSAFGDDHHEAIDAQIWVLSRALSASAPSEDSINNRYELDDEGRGQNVLDAALDARRWLLGEPMQEGDGETLAESWQELVIE